MYGAPAVDPATGRVYFGASDKRLYALDSRGLYLWSFATGDNVATRPALFGDTVIFGSEDRDVYSVEAATGRLRWQHRTGGAVVSAPLVAEIDGGPAVVVVGSDDGAAYGLDAATGEQRWVFDTGKPVEAPSVMADGKVLVTSTGGAVTALDPATGEVQWTADVGGRPVRYAPAVAADRFVVVDEQGYLSAYSLADGRRLWQSPEFDYVGAPLLLGGRLFVAATTARIREVNLDGRIVATWPAADAADVTDAGMRLDFGPVPGGGAVWTVDSRSVVRRLGPPLPGLARLRLDWLRQVNEPPFAMDLIRAAPLRVDDAALVIDEGGRVVDVDPATGAVRLRFETGVEAVRIEPVLAGDALVLTTPAGLTAVSLASGAPVWQVPGGTSVRPPEVAGDTLLRSSGTAAGEGVSLVALDAATGAPRWRRDFEGMAVPGGLVARGDAVYAAAPVAAFDLATGETRWEAPDLAGGIGSPALLGRWRHSLHRPAGPRIRRRGLALRAADGALVWRSPLGQETLSLLERPWLSGDAIVIPTLSGSALGLDAATGALKWRASLPAPRFGASDGRG